LKQAESGQVVTDVCRQMRISEATFYGKKKYANLGVPEVRELRQLRDENAHILQEVVKKKI
jgi:putative transposase